jgi:dipeptidase E
VPSPALDALHSSVIARRIIRHGPVGSLAEVAIARGVEPADVVKTMVVRCGESNYVFVLAPGDRAISWPKLRALLGVSRLSMPDATVAREVTGYGRCGARRRRADNAQCHGGRCDRTRRHEPARRSSGPHSVNVRAFAVTGLVADRAETSWTRLRRVRRMLLTSAGLRNATLKSALADLVGKPFAEASVAFIPTASVAAAGDHGWFVEDLSRLHGLGWRELDILELNGLPRQTILERLRHADVVYAEGGNHYHLANSIIVNDLAAEMAATVESKVYVGVSAGSMIFSRNLSEQTGEAFGEHDDLQILGEQRARSPVGSFDWYLKPHLNSPDFPNRTPAWFERAAAKLAFGVYALDDDSAVRVRGGQIDVVSDGTWRLLNSSTP